MKLRLWRRDTTGKTETWDVEEYLPNVVAHEVSSLHWPEEALRAQAVAARTYAYYHIIYPKHPRQNADLCTEICCQYFQLGTNLPALKAVADTRGEVLRNSRGELLQAEYHACCGGLIKGCPCHCHGARNGHGRGMCQLGCKEMALQGKTYRQILAFYYKDAFWEGQMNIAQATDFLFAKYGEVLGKGDIAYQPHFALAKAARLARMGRPLTNELRTMFQGTLLVYQFFAHGLVWCVDGKWDDICTERW